MGFSESAQEAFNTLIRRYPIKEAAMLPVLHLAQREWGHITPEIMLYVAKLLDVSPMKVRDVVTFYPMFLEQPPGKYLIRVCSTLPCALQESRKIVEHLRQRLGVDVADEHDITRGTTPDGKFTLMKVECLAACNVAPVMMVNETLHTELTPEKVDEILDGLE